ncbi:hypothetical protein [Nocardia camponoti]|uniref:hypothetical protein n=1 Tax=Nocardia camponoti TaxID=1616106 RepID=UPI00166E77B2|nr:hypothetical protein [Nocardia camponoti]
MTELQDNWLKNGLTKVMPDLRMHDLLTARPQLFQEPEFLVVARDTVADVPLAVLGSTWNFTSTGERFLNIGVQFVAAHLRGTDVFRHSWLAHLESVTSSGHFPALSALKTFNPIAYCAMRDYGRLPGSVMFPELQAELTHSDEALIASVQRIANVIRPTQDFDMGAGVFRDIGVPRDLYRKRPRSRDDQVNAYFEDNVAEGDRLLCVVHVRNKQTEDAIMSHFADGGRA